MVERRATQTLTEVEEKSTPERRSVQAVAQVMEQASLPERSVGQVLLEVSHSEPTIRLADQVLLEATDKTAAYRQVVQVILEVMCVPDQGVPTMPDEFPWPLTFDPGENDDGLAEPASYLGIGLRILMIKELAVRRRSIQVPRR